MLMAGFTIGYGPEEVEPDIAGLVAAVQDAGFVTFSSCEGHIPAVDEAEPRLPSVAFYAHEGTARAVHERFVECRPSLACSWVFRAGFVLRRETRDWALAWTLENCGISGQGDETTFARETLKAARGADIPLLIKLFATMSA
jgi:tRNA(Phe) wybutosine-synthesizing methylase Tyw3